MGGMKTITLAVAVLCAGCGIAPKEAPPAPPKPPFAAALTIPLNTPEPKVDALLGPPSSKQLGTGAIAGTVYFETWDYPDGSQASFTYGEGNLVQAVVYDGADKALRDDEDPQFTRYIDTLVDADKAQQRANAIEAGQGG